MQMTTSKVKLLSFVGLVMLADPAFAYMGPGLGLSAIAMMLSVFGSITFAFLAVVWYPIKRLYRRILRRPDDNPPPSEEEGHGR
jgi:hypothetical protein